ncbi:hypothetical protein RB595_005904 [Gaeumannomyces hyphopodioides]
MAPAQPELKKVGLFVLTSLRWRSTHANDALSPQYLDKKVFVQLNGSRKVVGVVRGYDVFLNIVLDEAFEDKDGGEKVKLGMVVIRGNSVVMLEAMERIGGDDRGHGGGR